MSLIHTYSIHLANPDINIGTQLEIAVLLISIKKKLLSNKSIFSDTYVVICKPSVTILVSNVRFKCDKSLIFMRACKTQYLSFETSTILKLETKVSTES